MTITLTREEAQQVLYALVSSTGELHLRLESTTDMQLINNKKAIETLRARLSAPEPDAPTPRDQYCYERGYQRALEVIRQTPQREWQGLTDEEMEAVANSVEYNPLAMTVYEYRVAVQKATSAKLREKNT
ncbi:hypothetical protein EBT25_06515 [bacterium]|jgi:hypothetical protein|nr:hypothetical protein [bacterium]